MVKLLEHHVSFMTRTMDRHISTKHRSDVEPIFCLRVFLASKSRDHTAIQHSIRAPILRQTGKVVPIDRVGRCWPLDA